MCFVLLTSCHAPVVNENQTQDVHDTYSYSYMLVMLLHLWFVVYFQIQQQEIQISIVFSSINAMLIVSDT